MDEQRLRKLGSIKSKELSKSFDEYYDAYKSKAEESGYTGEVKFIKEHGMVFIYVVID
jgi:hypothetical protein